MMEEEFIQKMGNLVKEFGVLLPFLSGGKIQFMMARDMLANEDKLPESQKILFQERLTELINSADGLIKIVKGEETFFSDESVLISEK